MAEDMQKSGIAFRKMHGAGNDFVVIDQRGEPHPLSADLVRAIGDRHRGVGFDQLAEIWPDDGAAARLVFWNADGSQSSACGNATRCIAAWMMPGTGEMRLRTERGLLICRRRLDGSVEVDMGPASLGWDDIPLAEECDTAALPLPGKPAACSMGNPHCTFFVESAEEVDLARLGPDIEHHPLFPERTTVQVVEVLTPDLARVRVWERGVGVTLASGSSACAVLVNGQRRGLLGRQAVLMLDGGEIEVSMDDRGHLLMAGPSAHVFDGVFHSDAEAEVGG
ncbi:MAG: diaminopimelate epimerase [Pseudomonadota bacterium]